MPYARRIRKRTFRRRTTTRRRPIFKTRRVRTARPRAAPAYRITRYTDQLFQIGTLNVSGGTPVSSPGILSTLTATAGNELNSYLFAFRLEELPNDSEFTNLFRFFKIAGVRITLSMRGTDAFVNGTSTGGLPILAYSWAPDLSPSEMPTSLQAARQRANMKRVYFSNTKRMHSIFIRPVMTTMVADNTSATSYQGRRVHTYLQSSTDKSARHAGLWLNIDNTTSSSAVTLDVEVKYYLSFRGAQ